MPSSRTTTGLPPGVQVGPTGPRLLAALVEVGPVWLLIGLALLFGLVLDGRLVIALLFLLLALVWAILTWAQRATRAAGPGMRLDSLQIVGFSDGRPVGWARVLIRCLVYTGLTVSVVGLIAMAVVMARHPRRQGWHDLAVNAVVINERPLAPPRPKAAVARPAVPAGGSARASTGASAAAAAGAEAAPSAAVDAESPAVVTSLAASPASPPTSRQASTPMSTPADVTAVDQSEPMQVEPVPVEETDETTGESDHEWWLLLDDGRDVGVDSLVLLGRNPQPRVGEEDATLIKVADETRTVSKSHLAVGVDAGGLYVMDRGSTNGTTVTAPDGGQRPCPPGDLIDVPAGSVVSFGDHWLEVRRPGG